MKRLIKQLLFCCLAAAGVWLGMLVIDTQALHDELIRLRVVAASDSGEDQHLILRLRSAVVESLQENMAVLTDAEQAQAYLRENLPKIEALANRVLEETGYGDRISVNLNAEDFLSRIHDTVTLPAEIYEALRITIEEGKEAGLPGE